MDNEPIFSLNDFKKWMKNQEDQEPKATKLNLTGTAVESKVNSKRLVENMIVDAGEKVQLAIDFRKNGGTILAVEGKNFLIEVASGAFFIPRNYVKRA